MVITYRINGDDTLLDITPIPMPSTLEEGIVNALHRSDFLQDDDTLVIRFNLHTYHIGVRQAKDWAIDGQLTMQLSILQFISEMQPEIDVTPIRTLTNSAVSVDFK